MKQPFANNNTNGWDSTLKNSRQNVDTIGQTSQNKIKAKRSSAEKQLLRGMQGKKR